MLLSGLAAHIINTLYPKMMALIAVMAPLGTFTEGFEDYNRYVCLYLCILQSSRPVLPTPLQQQPVFSTLTEEPSYRAAC